MKKKKKEEEILDTKQQDQLPEGVKIHENGEWYKEIIIEGSAEPFKLFNTLKDARLDGETRAEYKTRRLFANMEKKRGYGEMFYNPYENAKIGLDGKLKGVPYVNKNKKDKFKKK